MKAEDLMINDWISINGSNYKVKNIKKNGVIKLYENNQWGECEIELNTDYLELFVEPIPLTSEILEKNGWTLKEWGCHRQFQYTTEECGDEFIYKIDYIGTHFIVPCFRCDIEIKYVHELQHALKLCGIEKDVIL